MKKSSRLLTFVLVSTLGGGSCAWADSEKSYLYDYEGNIVLMRNEAAQKLKSDTPIQKGDVLKTDTHGTADIIMNQLAGARIFGGSECLFENIRSSSSHLVFSQGQALFSLKPMPRAAVFNVETPVAIIHADIQTQFSCTINGEGPKTSTTILVKKGSLIVEVKSSGAQINVLQGQAVEISAETFISPPRATTAEEDKLLAKINSIIISDEAVS